jgi:hypothetical protein
MPSFLFYTCLYSHRNIRCVNLLQNTLWVSRVVGLGDEVFDFLTGNTRLETTGIVKSYRQIILKLNRTNEVNNQSRFRFCYDTVERPD